MPHGLTSTRVEFTGGTRHRRGGFPSTRVALSASERHYDAAFVGSGRERYFNTVGCLPLDAGADEYH